MEKKQDEMKLMLTIVERGYGRALTKLYRKHHVTVHFQSQGHGTASSELLDVLDEEGRVLKSQLLYHNRVKLGYDITKSFPQEAS